MNLADWSVQDAIKERVNKEDLLMWHNGQIRRSSTDLFLPKKSGRKQQSSRSAVQL
jgi:hypothetical protein